MRKQIDSLQKHLRDATQLLGQINSEADLSTEEIDVALQTYKQLQRVLSISTRTGDWTSSTNKMKYSSPDESFRGIYKDLMEEFDRAEASIRDVYNEQPAAVRSLGRESLSDCSDFFILDNSLRETTVGNERGHTLEEKHKIVDAIADSGLQEVILGAFGSKISVDSQIASRWTSLGKSFDCTWGFSSAYDMEPYDQTGLWQDYENFVSNVHSGEMEYHKDNYEYYEPELVVKNTYDTEDLVLFKQAFKDFPAGAFGGMTPEAVLRSSESSKGRIPMGLLMMAGFGICNAIIEIDATYEKFDYKKYDVVERLKFLMDWCQRNLPKRKDEHGSTKHARVFINFTDFSNWKNSEEKGALEKVMFLIYSLSSLPELKRPFGYMMEDPTAWLFPDEIGKYTRMVRLMMDRAGHKQGKFLVHIHMYFGLAEANTLTCLANGADGVWAAMCTVGAQVGHACSTVTATNLVRAGQTHLAQKYNLEKMCKSARIIHSVSAREPCPGLQEVYGERAFDVAFMMIAVPHCRYALSILLRSLGVEERKIRLDELSTVEMIKIAMVQHFGPAEEAGWDPVFCERMRDALNNHLLTGLSRDYNSPLGLGHLYGQVSKKKLSAKMVSLMLKDSDIPDFHPTILEFVTRWNRLCARLDGEELPLPGSLAPSCMMYAQDITVKPRRLSVPFAYWIKDVVVYNHVMKPIPKLFKRYIVKMMTDTEKGLQGTNNPTMEFFDLVLRLKLFIVEADSLGVLPLVDDFSVRKNHAFFFGDDHLWIREVSGTRSRAINQLLRCHIDYYPRFYATKGNNALMRCIRSAAKRVAENKGLIDDLRWLREGEEKLALEQVSNDTIGRDMAIAESLYRQQSKRGSSGFSGLLADNEPQKGPLKGFMSVDAGVDPKGFYKKMQQLLIEDPEVGDDFSRFLDAPDAVEEAPMPFSEQSQEQHGKRGRKKKIFGLRMFQRRRKHQLGAINE